MYEEQAATAREYDQFCAAHGCSDQTMGEPGPQYSGAVEAFRKAVRWAAMKDEQLKVLRRSHAQALNEQHEAYAEVVRTRDEMTAAIAKDLLPE